MSTQQLVLSLVLLTMVFSVALELRLDDFKRVATAPRAVVVGLIPQFVLLPVATWAATMVLDLPANTEAAMILVASCPGGSLSNVVTHFGRGNTALSVSISAVASVMALVLTPLNFTWMVATNPATAGWLRELAIDPSGIWWSLLALLALPMALGLALAHRAPAVAERIRKPLGSLCARAFGLSVRDRRAVIIEGGMQNSGLALGIIAVQFNADLGMVIVASLWGIWHIVSGMALAWTWRQQDARSAD